MRGEGEHLLFEKAVKKASCLAMTGPVGLAVVVAASSRYRYISSVLHDAMRCGVRHEMIECVCV